MNRSESPSPGLRPPSPPKAGERDGEGEVHGESPFVFSHTFVKTMNLVRNPKRRSSGALQNLADLQAAVTNAPASWSAVVLRRFRRATGLGIPAVHGEPPFAFCACIGTLNLMGNPKRRSGGVLQDLADLQAAVNQRASVLECGDAPPLSAREWTLVFLRFMERAPVRIFAAGPRFALSPD